MKATQEEGTRSCPMNGGDGQTSYARNSSYQRNGATTALTMIEEAIAKDLHVKPSFRTNSGEPFRIADLGCSSGPNTFLVVGAIVQAVKLKYQQSHGNVPEFQAFFNDIGSNDFNTLVRSPLWESHQYFSAVVPGSFHGRLFPKASIDFFYSSYALHWLSGLPKEMMDDRSAAWNKGKICNFGSKREVESAYQGQFAMDAAGFLQARADEIVVGGFIALIIPFQERSSDIVQFLPVLTNLLEAAVSDMVIKGRLDEGKVDSFNIPSYLPTADELKVLVEKNGSFSIEKMQPLFPTKMAFDARAVCNFIRAAIETMISTHLGSEMMDEIFDRYYKKIEESSHLILQSMEVSQDMFLLLKRKTN